MLARKNMTSKFIIRFVVTHLPGTRNNIRDIIIDQVV